MSSIPNAAACNYLAYMWAEKGVKLDQAFKYVSKALKLNPKSGAFLDTLGWIYYMNEQYKEALEQISHAAEIIPDDPTIIDHLGDVFDKLGDEKQALSHWERSFVLDPENAKVAEKLSQHGADVEALRKQADELNRPRLEERKPLLRPGCRTPACWASPFPIQKPASPCPTSRRTSSGGSGPLLDRHKRPWSAPM